MTDFSGVPTQVRHPWRTALRTALQVTVSLAVVVPAMLALVQTYLGEYLPAEAMGALAWGAGLLVAVSSLVAGIMAIPAVNRQLTRWGVGPTPRPGAEADIQDFQ